MSERTSVSENINSVCMPAVANNNEEENDFLLPQKEDFDDQKLESDEEAFWGNEEYEAEYEEEYVAPYEEDQEATANEQGEPLIAVPSTPEIVKDLRWLEENALEEFQKSLVIQKSYKTKTSRKSQTVKNLKIKSSRPKRMKKREDPPSVNNNLHDERLEELDCSTDSSGDSSYNESSSSEEDQTRKRGKGIRSHLKLRNFGEDPLTTKRRTKKINADLPLKISDEIVKLLEPNSSKWKFGQSRVTAFQTKDEIDFGKFLSDIGMTNTLRKDELQYLKRCILEMPENFRNSFVKKYRDKMIAADASSQAGKKSEEDKLEDEWDKFFEEDETDWCTKQKAKVDIVQNKIHEKLVEKLKKNGKLNLAKIKPIVDDLIQKENAKEQELKKLMNDLDELKKKVAERKEAAERTSSSDTESEDDSGALEAKLASIIES